MSCTSMLTLKLFYCALLFIVMSVSANPSRGGDAKPRAVEASPDHVVHIL